MNRRKFLSAIALGAYSCNISDIGSKTIPADENFFVNSDYVNNVGEPLFKFDLKGKTVYLIPSTRTSIDAKPGKKLERLKEIRLSITNKTYEGNDIYTISELIYSDSTKTK